MKRRSWGRRMGRCLDRLNPVLSSAMEGNLFFVIEEESHRRRIAQQTVKNFGAFLFEFLGRSPKEDLLSRVEDHAASLWGWMEGGKGAIILTAHLGNWEVAAQYAALRMERPTAIIARSLGDPEADALFERVRFQNGVQTFRPAPDGRQVREWLRFLKGGGMIATAVEGTPPSSSGEGKEGRVTVRFMGRSVEFPSGPARLARMSKLPLVPAAFSLRGDDGFQVESSAPVFVSSEEGGLQSAMQSVAEALENFIKRSPEQWMLFERRFSSSE